MVTTIIISITIISVASILSFRGITIKYDKHFTINDKRNQTPLTSEQISELEKRINDPFTPQEGQQVAGTTGTAKVIESIHNLFGPDIEEDNRG